VTASRRRPGYRSGLHPTPRALQGRESCHGQPCKGQPDRGAAAVKDACELQVRAAVIKELNKLGDRLKAKITELCDLTD